VIGKLRFSLLILAIIAGYTWVLAPRTPRWVAHLVTTIVVALAVARATRTGEWGLRREAFLPALRGAAAFTLLAALAIYAVGSVLGKLPGREHPGRDLAFLVPWALGQQFALQTVLLREAQAATSRGKGIVLAAAIFGALHLPNPFLTLVTVLGALVWCRLYDRHPNLIPAALSHALLTLAILSCFDPRITGRLRVGYSYLQLR
jgi:membrane protease YdiL (CAAX protease family)